MTDEERLVKIAIHDAMRLIANMAVMETIVPSVGQCAEYILNNEISLHWVCTRPKDHKGPHIAMVGGSDHLCAVWFTDAQMNKKYSKGD